jgi:hypothetical protein
VRLFPSDGRHLSCHTSYPVCTPRPSQLLVVVGFGLLWRAERLRSLYEKPPIILPELASARRYLSILYNNAWLDACTRHTFLSVRADVDFACRRVLSTTSPTSLDRLQTIGDGRGVETDPQILIALESPCLSPTLRLRGQQKHSRSRVYIPRSILHIVQSHESICKAAFCPSQSAMVGTEVSKPFRTCLLHVCARSCLWYDLVTA